MVNPTASSECTLSSGIVDEEDSDTSDAETEPTAALYRLMDMSVLASVPSIY